MKDNNTDEKAKDGAKPASGTDTFKVFFLLCCQANYPLEPLDIANVSCNKRLLSECK